MQGFREKFEAYGGDYTATMRRFLENEALYRKLFGKFFQDDSLQKLGDAIEAGDLTAAFEAAHTLKGVTGNLGLTPLYGAVCSLVEPLRAGERLDYSALYQNVQLEYQKAEALWETLKEAD